MSEEQERASRDRGSEGEGIFGIIFFSERGFLGLFFSGKRGCFVWGFFFDFFNLNFRALQYAIVGHSPFFFFLLLVFFVSISWLPWLAIRFPFFLIVVVGCVGCVGWLEKTHHFSPRKLTYRIG